MSLKQRGKCSVLDGLRQVGCLKARFPRPDDAAWLHVVTLNTSGGVAGGDVLDTAIAVGAEARATIASQAAERFYRALPGSAASRVRTRIAVAEGGAAEWLPQETILFDRCAVRRHLRVELAADAWFLGVESLVFGRAAMGEVVRTGDRCAMSSRCGAAGDCCCTMQSVWTARWRRRCSGRAIADGARAVATIVHVAPDAEAALDAVRAASPTMQCQRLGRHADRAYACRRRCVAARCGDRRVGGLARRAATAARMAVLRGNG